jgi:hypothetical protein
MGSYISLGETILGYGRNYMPIWKIHLCPIDENI